MRRRIWIVFFVLLAAILACGGNGLVPSGDTGVPDAIDGCECPSAATLNSDDLTHTELTSIISAFSRGGVIFYCLPEANRLVLAGSCMGSTLTPNMNLIGSGLSRPPDIHWVCDWFNNTAVPAEVTLAATCLEVPTSAAPAAECDCLPVEPIENRIVRSQRAGLLSPGTVSSVQTSCSDGGLLIGGSCQTEYNDVQRELQMTSSGFESDDTWKCSWRNPTADSTSGQATAICVAPPPTGTAPESEPLSDTVVRVSNSAALPAGNLQLLEASCAPGDFLLWGSCALESPEAASHEAYLFRAGFQIPSQFPPTTWQCGWNNPGELTPTATATAVCLKQTPE